MNTPNLTPAERRDAETGMAWWNDLTDEDRRFWMEVAGNTGVAVDAWEAFKRSTDQPMSDSDTIQQRMRWQIGQTTGLTTDAVLQEGADLIDAQRDEIAKLRAEVHRFQEYVREREFPQPPRIKAVIGRAGQLDYALQITRVCHDPDVTIMVSLPFQPAGDE